MISFCGLADQFRTHHWFTLGLLMGYLAHPGRVFSSRPAAMYKMYRVRIFTWIGYEPGDDGEYPSHQDAPNIPM